MRRTSTFARWILASAIVSSVAGAAFIERHPNVSKPFILAGLVLTLGLCCGV